MCSHVAVTPVRGTSSRGRGLSSALQAEDARGQLQPCLPSSEATPVRGSAHRAPSPALPRSASPIQTTAFQNQNSFRPHGFLITVRLFLLRFHQQTAVSNDESRANRRGGAEGRGRSSGTPRRRHAACRLDAELSPPARQGHSARAAAVTAGAESRQTGIYWEALCKAIPAFPEEEEDGGAPCSPHAGDIPSARGGTDPAQGRL